MRRLLLLALIGTLSGCFTFVNVAVLDRLGEDKTESVEVPLQSAVALRTGEGFIEVGLTYADGYRKGVRLQPAQGRFEWIDMPWPPSEGLGLPIKGELGGEGLSIVGQVLRCWEEGAPPLVVPLNRTEVVTVPRSAGDKAMRGLRGALAVLALPLSLGLDVGTLPLQLLALCVYRMSGGGLIGSMLSFG